MTGLEAISHHNGWAMALTGACIVFCGLSVLALVISQLRKVVEMLEKKPEAIPKNDAKPALKVKKKPEIKAAPEPPSLDFAGAEGIYKPLTEDLGSPFELVGLYAAAKDKGLPHPHLSIKHLRESGLLTPTGDGAFHWASDNT